ncbi:amidohydrolase [Cohnella hongkongensis]|uniref:Amidohydrolase n=1 Tax=Cohnella hongkongensis TaxID=178337 RepID=A0ABV9F989_9BACL
MVIGFTAGKADLMISGRAVFTGIGNSTKPGAIAIAGNRIVALGDTEAELEGLIGPRTRILRYGNHLIMAGFQDFHLHVLLGSLFHDSVNLLSAASEEEAARMTKAFADARPDDPWIFGFSWHHAFWETKTLPHRSTLDRYLSDRPVFLLNAEGHGAWLNSRALMELGITSDSPNPPYGQIHKDESGVPTGFLYETAMSLAQSAFCLPHARKHKLLRSFLEKAAKLGITSVSDMFPMPGLQLDNLDIYREYEANGELTARIHFQTALNGDLAYPRKLRETCSSDKLRFSGLKQYLDGVPTLYTALLLDPYSDRPETKGDTLIPPDLVTEWILQADKEGFRVRLHACGDGAVRLGLDCFEAARLRNGARDSRHTIEHVEVICRSDLRRFAELGVVASMQPEHIAATQSFKDNPYLVRLGKEREPLTWPIRTLMNNRAHLAFGSDYPVVELDPMLGIYRAATRLHNDGQPEGGWNPKERLGVADALRAYTSGSAYGMFTERDTGTLEVGKLADIIVLDRNIIETPVEEIRETKVLMTMMDGKIVYEA